MTARLARRARGAALGLVADRFLGEPPAHLHPVAAFARIMTTVEQGIYRDSAVDGSVYAAGGVAIGVGAGAVTGSTVVAVALGAAGRMLRREAIAIEQLLGRGELAAARRRLSVLCGRDASALNQSGIAAAVIESVAENTVDAVVAPALWAVALGAPGTLAYRAVNTMDAMVGHRDGRYDRFGWCAARLDDAANLVPARITAALVVALRPTRGPAIARCVRRDAPAHPSPNAGVAEAAFAGALDVELGGKLRYGARVEHRPRLGRGVRPQPPDIGRAVRLADQVDVALVALLLVPTLVARARRRRR
ncbi:MAG: adenosylcobinamide-phosphate synthase CbiB [Acidimicrobiia bacterium]